MRKEPPKEVAVGRCVGFSFLHIYIYLEYIPSDVLMKSTVVGM